MRLVSLRFPRNIRPLLVGQKFEESGHREQQRLRIAVVQVSSGQEVRTDHFQTVASGSIASQHQSRGFDSFLDNRHLALIKFEVDNLPRLCYFSGEFSSLPPAENPPSITHELCATRLHNRTAADPGVPTWPARVPSSSPPSSILSSPAAADVRGST